MNLLFLQSKKKRCKCTTGKRQCENSGWLKNLNSWSGIRQTKQDLHLYNEYVLKTNPKKPPTINTKPTTNPKRFANSTIEKTN